MNIHTLTFLCMYNVAHCSAEVYEIFFHESIVVVGQKLLFIYFRTSLPPLPSI